MSKVISKADEMINKFLAWCERFYGRESHNNQMYGHNIILKNYTNAKLPYIIPGELQHGWHNDCGIHVLAKHGDKEKSLPYFVWTRRNLEKSIEYGYKNVTAIGAPFLYLPSTTYSGVSHNDSKSLLLFPAHASEFEPFFDPLRTFKAYLEEIEELYPLFNSITVCLYWAQYEDKKIRKLLEDKGIPVVTLGHRDNNQNFLEKFQKLVNKYEYIASNHFCSAIMYSLYMRKKVFIYGSNQIKDIKLMMWENRKIYDHDYFSNLYPELLWENFDDESHYWIGEKELGLDFKRSPKELRDIFGWHPQNFVKSNLLEHNLNNLHQLATKISRGLWR